MTVYVDSSAVLRALFNRGDAYGRFGEWDAAVSSELLLVECHRTMHRLRLEGRITDETLSEYRLAITDFIDTIAVVEVTPEVMKRASEPFPTVIGSLDAIHLASALLWQEERDEEILILTHDMQLAVTARACGIRTIG
ncbi:MAG: type II toxin-antitoxin system VapC family toxin [Spirochaetes bacterium]|nr:type II toxin-antitoxin system VapC family toxin [Spirochaetota bacterium]